MDLITSVVSRFYPTSKDDQHREELGRLLREFIRRHPGLAREFEDTTPVSENGKVVGYAIKIKNSGVSQVVEAFAARMGLALYREISGKVLPVEGGIQILWYSNVDAMNGTLPTDLTSIMGPHCTLKAGMKDMANQFTYQYATAEDHSVVAVWMAFRFSFAFAAFIRVNAGEFGSMAGNVFRPGFLKGWTPPEGRGPALQMLHRAKAQAMERWQRSSQV